MKEIVFSLRESQAIQHAFNKKADDMICLSFYLDIGDIKNPIDSIERKKWLDSIEPCSGDTASSLYDMSVQGLQRLYKAIDDKETIRIWVSETPYSKCGLCHVCSYLEQYDHTLMIVRCPEYIVCDSGIRSFFNWADIGTSLSNVHEYETTLSCPEVRMYSLTWRLLQEENSPLRSIINGKLCSVSIDFYDFLIWKWISDEPKEEKALIGDLLGNTQIGVEDWWFHQRIEYYIQQQKIEVVKASNHPYDRVLCRTK